MGTTQKSIFKGEEDQELSLQEIRVRNLEQEDIYNQNVEEYTVYDAMNLRNHVRQILRVVGLDAVEVI